MNSSNCCVCGNSGTISGTENVLPDGLLASDNSASVDDPRLWPIHQAHAGIVIRGELPVKIHAHFPNVPKSRLMNPLSAVCTQCFKVIYSVLQLEKQMLRMKSKLKVKAGTVAELTSDCKLLNSQSSTSSVKRNLRKKTIKAGGGLSVTQNKRKADEIQDVANNDDDSNTQSSYQTRAKRKGAFTGLSKEIIQAELEDEDSYHDTLAFEIEEAEDDSREIDGKNKTTRNKRVHARKQIQMRSSNVKNPRKSFRLKVTKSELKKSSSTDQETAENLKEESVSLDDELEEHQQIASSIPDNEKFFCCPKCCVFFRKEEFKEFQSHVNEVCAIRKRRKVYVSEMSKIYELLQSGDNGDTNTRETIEDDEKKSTANTLERIKKELEVDNWPTDQKTAETIGKSSGSWKCWICFYESAKKSFWLTHMKRVHPDAKGISLTCEHCQFPFIDKHHLREHLNEMHAHETGSNCEKFGQKSSQHICVKIKCDICELSFKTQGSKTKHMLTHPEYKPFPCEICPKTFKKREYLSLHMRVHNDTRPYQCDFCPMKFRSKSHYNNHKRIHTGEKPYVCDSCGRCFISPQCLHNHMNSHSETKKFSCEVCDKMFRTVYDVKRHRVIHTEEKPFQCKICRKSFNRRGNCLAHERKHAEKGFTDPFICHICEEIFDRPNKLDKHIKKAHGRTKISDTRIDSINVPATNTRTSVKKSIRKVAKPAEIQVQHTSSDGTLACAKPTQLQIVNTSASSDAKNSSVPVYFTIVPSEEV